MTKLKLSEWFNFRGRTVVVTGGSMGIGYAIVRRFAEAGANLVIADVSEVGAEKAANLKKEFGGETLFVKTDVSSEADVKNLIDETIKKFGQINVMINDAGIFPLKSVLNMDLAFWEKTQAINLRGVFLCCREAAKVMIQKGGGNIINIASVDALHPSMIGLAAYDASKHGVWGFTKNLALELAEKNIRVNAIAPGGVRTEGVEKTSGGTIKASTNPDAPKEATSDVPMKRLGEPDEIAAVALFLASDASSYMTGSLVVVDGGLLLK